MNSTMNSQFNSVMDSKMNLDVLDSVTEEKVQSETIDPEASPPLRPMIPSNHIGAATGNPLDNLKERYYKQQLPPSLRPTKSEQELSAQNGHGVEPVPSPID